jgi:hypothetical protein
VEAKTQTLSFNILNEIFEAFNAQLKQRIDQILHGEDVDMIIYFRLGHLLELFNYTLCKLLGNASSFPMYLLEYAFTITVNSLD